MQGFVSGLRTAQQATTDFADRTATFARDNEQHLDRVGKASMVMGGAILGGILLAVKSFSEFDSAMSEVEASTHETAANMDLLREAAINAGADTAFSAKEAAQGIDELAKAGVSTKDILAGGLTGALSLAAAGSLGVGEAAEIAASALTQFKLSGQDIPHLADLLAAGAGKAQGSVQDLGAALNQAGLVAASTGLSIEETTGGLSAFASAGLTGSDAGTSFKSMLQRLTPQSKEAETMMAELGLSAYDAQGNFKGLAAFSGNLKDSMKDLTPEARNAAMGVIFGSDAVRAANVLYEQGAEGITEWTNKVDDAGFAANTARIKTDNLAGDLERLGGSFDSVLIKGGGGAAEALRGLVQTAEDAVDAFGSIPAPVLNAGVGIASITGGALLAGGAFMTLLPKVMEMRTSFQALTTSAPRTAGAISAIGKAAGIAAVAMIGFTIFNAVAVEQRTKSTDELANAILGVANNAKFAKASASDLDSVFQGWTTLMGKSAVEADTFSEAIARITNPKDSDGLNRWADQAFGWTGLAKSETTEIDNRLKSLGDTMGELAKGGATDAAAKSFKLLTEEFEKNGSSAQDALNHVPGYKDALLSLGNAAGVALTDQELLDFALGKVPDSMKQAADSTDRLARASEEAAASSEALSEGLAEVGLSAHGAVTDIQKFTQVLFAAGLLSLSASDAAIAYQDSIDAMTASVVKNGTSLDINTEAGRANQGAYNSLAKAAMATAEATATETLAAQGSAAAQEQLQASMQGSYDDLIRAAGQLGITGDAADTMARKALGIPKEVPINTWVNDKASSTLDGIKGKADALDGRSVTMTIRENTYRTSYEKRVREADGGEPEGGGLYGSYATGGRVHGPGTTTSDSIPAFLSKDEFVIKASAAAKIGYANLERMNGGDTQPLKGGVQYAPASAPARTVSVSAPTQTTVAAPAVTVMIGNEQLDSRMYRVAGSVISAADSNSRYTRAGR